MPLFESIEGDVTAFFVSQGSVFDGLVKSFMERMAHVEMRIDALVSDTSGDFQRMNQLIHAVSMSADAHAAAAAAAAAAALAQQTQTTTASISTTAERTHISNSIETSSTMIHMDTHELEYYIMTLSRQLHVVLELFFQPYAHDVAHGIQAKQARFETISDVLTQNEAILMQLAAMDAHASIHTSSDDQQQQQQQHQEGQNHLEHERGDPTDEHEDSKHTADEHPRARSASDIAPILESHDEVDGNDDGDDDKGEASQVDAVPGAVVDAMETGEQESAEELLADKEDATPGAVESCDGTHPLPSASIDHESADSEGQTTVKASEPASGVTYLPQQREARGHIELSPRVAAEKAAAVDNPGREKFANREQRRRVGKDTTRHRKKSLYDSFRDFHELQLSEDERQRLKEQEMLRKVRQLVQEARSQWQQEFASSLAITWQQKLREIESQQLKLQREWQYHQEQQSPKDLVLQQQQQQQLAFDRQFTAFNTTFLSAQQTQEQQTARILESLREFQDQFVQKADFDRMATAWLQTARDECVFGVSTDALAAFQKELEGFQAQLSCQELSPALEKLMDEVKNVLELLDRILKLVSSDSGGLHGPEGFQVMQTLRTFLTMLDDLVQSVESDKDLSAKSAAFISETLRQMELGTANLLDAFESQQERYQQAFEQQQLAIAQLQRELWEQKQADHELKSQLAGCPSQEDTIRFIQELRDQINASVSGSATRMLETVDELRLRMGGLPSAEIVERLALAVQKKADRAEMDRLERLLATANSGPVAPVGSMMKAPMKCLSCDQSLPYAHTGGSSSPEHHGGSHPHSHPYPQQHTCTNEPETPLPQYYYYSAKAPGSPEPGFRELFAISTAASHRRKQRQLALSLALSSNNWADSIGSQAPGSRPSFVNLDDGRNRIPLRRTVLSDQVVYGPAITPNAFKKRALGTNRLLDTEQQQRTSRPKTALPPDRRGEIITRSISSTVVIHPFAEQLKDPEKRAKY